MAHSGTFVAFVHVVEEELLLSHSVTLARFLTRVSVRPPSVRSRAFSTPEGPLCARTATTSVAAVAQSSRPSTLGNHSDKKCRPGSNVGQRRQFWGAGVGA